VDIHLIIDRFSQNRAVFENLLSNVSPSQARWKPTPEKWSMLEVVNHLYDEEREDFRMRLKCVLEDPKQPLPPIDPRDWVVTRAYNERVLEDSLNNFLKERDNSLEWLKTLKSPSWEQAHQRPTGPLSAGDLVASWVAHDFLHIRQLARLHWQYVGLISQPFKTDYGGPWAES
jgi:hypothetical protein